MSLATASAGGGFSAGAGGAGMAMAHHAGAVGRAAPPPQQEAHSAFGGAGAPPSVAALGADLLDKDQSLSLKQLKNSSHLPIVSVDLYGSEPQIARFPPKSTKAGEIQFPSSSGALSTLRLNATEASHKTLRKWLSKSKGYDSVESAVLSGNEQNVEVLRPHQLLGMRRLKDVPLHVRESYSTDDGDSPAIAEEANAGSIGLSIANGTMDGGTPNGDDYDRVVFKVRLHESKKALTMLPEEALNLLLSQANFKVARETKSEEEDEEILEFPMAFSVPSWACSDSGVEALMDAVDGTAVLFQRNVAALAGALFPGAQKGTKNLILDRLRSTIQENAKEFQKQNHDDDDEEFSDESLLIVVGISADGIDCTAISVSDYSASCPSCLFGNFKVLTNVAYAQKDPLSVVSKCIKKLQATLEELAPEMDLPVAFVTHGTVAEQLGVNKALKATKLGSWGNVPMFSTKPDCVAVGTAILGAVGHGRLVSPVDGATSKKHMTQRAVRIQNVAPTAVGLRMNYHGGASSKWAPVKVIFDFDRRVPAGPQVLDLDAAECAAHRNAEGLELAKDDVFEAAKQYQGSKGIPQREEAALQFRMQIMQKLTRNGEWMAVGGPMSPLSKRDDDDEDVRHACESAKLELSLVASGIITATLASDGKSVVQATKSARNSKLRYYAGVLLAIAFFGGFLIKSYWEERVFERDTERVLAYYKHVVPGSFQDGDRQNARYLVWKYGGKKDKLWRRLEVKYGEPVRHADEWGDYEASDQDEEVNLDDEGSTEEAEGEESSKEEQDL